MIKRQFTAIEICAGAGGQALGLEQAGFKHIDLIEIDHNACETLKLNRPSWSIIESDVKNYSASEHLGRIDLLAGGVPCPPFSIAGKQLGKEDDRDLFPEMLRLAAECKPKAIMIENVRGILSKKFSLYRKKIVNQLNDIGYWTDWQLIYSSDYGVSQLRPRSILVGFLKDHPFQFLWPEKHSSPETVGELLISDMKKNGWHGADAWAKNAKDIAPTIVGGSKKHGGPDLGPSRARAQWEKLGVKGSSIAEDVPDRDFEGLPRLTLGMVAQLQGFPRSWKFTGKKTSAYRQIGNAFPPPVAMAIGKQIYKTLLSMESQRMRIIPNKRMQSDQQIAARFVSR